jgi:hypothetical protein
MLEKVTTDPGTAPVPGATACRFCGRPLATTFVDLGMSPLCESFLAAHELEQMEPFFPLHVRVCDACRLVQLPAFVAPDEIFREYAYFSAFSTSWVEHARRYVGEMIERLGLGESSFVVEIASNDGYLLQHFVGTGIPILGIEPARNVAEAAVARGVPTTTEFFTQPFAESLVAERGHADLVIGNNVLAQVPDLNDFVAGVATLLAEGGSATFEFPHVLRLIEGLQFDTIYHEHFSYFSLATTIEIARAHGLDVYDVQELPTHGGSLRVFLCHQGALPRESGVETLLAVEADAGLHDPSGYAGFDARVQESKRRLLSLLIELRDAGKSVAGYGAPGKGNTLLNYCGIRSDLIAYTVDRNPYKHGKFLPGTHIPIHEPDRIAETKPDYVVVLPWNLIDEISEQLEYVADWGGRLVVPIPHAEIRAPGRQAAA